MLPEGMTSDLEIGKRPTLSKFNPNFVADLGPLIGDHYLSWLPFCREAVLSTVGELAHPGRVEEDFGLIASELQIARVESVWINPLRTYLQRSGKLLRPYIVCFCLEAYGRNPRDWPRQVAIAEIIHSSSLIMDDIIDDSFSRRGAPSAHQMVGARIAGSAASAWLNFIFAIVYRDRARLGTQTASRIIEQISWEHAVTGVGQVLDVGWSLLGGQRTRWPYLQGVVHRSTAYTYRMPFKLGALTAGAPDADVEQLALYAERIGIAFQIIDDILNVKPADAHWGKEFAEDISQGKFTLQVIIALERAQPDKAARLREILNSHTAERTVLAEAVAIIEETGAFDECKRLAHSFIEEAKRSVSQLSISDLFRRRLQAFADYVVERRR